MTVRKEMSYILNRIAQEEAHAAAADDLHAYLAHAQMAALYRQRFGRLCTVRATGGTAALAA